MPSMFVKINSDNTSEFHSALSKALLGALEEIGIRAEGYARSVVPVDTGRLKASIRHTVDAGDYSVDIGSDVSYASYVELGTSKMKARPFLRPAAQNHAEEYMSIVEKHLRNA